MFFLSAVLLPTKSPVSFAIFWIDIFEAALSASGATLASVATLVTPDLGQSRLFWIYLPITFLTIFLAKDKIDILRFVSRFNGTSHSIIDVSFNESWIYFE